MLIISGVTASVQSIVVLFGSQFKEDLFKTSYISGVQIKVVPVTFFCFEFKLNVLFLT